MEIIGLFKYTKSPIRLIMKSDQTIIRKCLMEQIHHTTLLIGIKDQNITFDKAIQHDTHIEVIATLDYQPPKCRHDRGKNKGSIISVVGNSTVEIIGLFEYQKVP